MAATTTRAPRRRPRPRSPRNRVAAVRLSLLGAFSVTADGVECVIPKGARRLVALVALHPHGISRTGAALALAPHLAPASATGSLRATAPTIVTADATALRIAPGVTVDAWELEALATQLPEASGFLTEHFDLDQLTRELLPGWEDDWLLLERAHLQELSLYALELSARQLADSGCVLAAITTAYHALRIDPLRETAARLLIEIQLHEGNQAQAARSYLDFRARLRQALGVEPTEATRTLVVPLLAGRSQR